MTISPFGPAVSEATKKKALEARAALAQGQRTIFKGPLKANTGKLALAAGVEVVQKDVQLELMGYLVDGVVGNLPD